MERRPPGPENQINQKARTADVLDDTTLMTVVTALYAFVQIMAYYGLDPCTC